MDEQGWCEPHRKEHDPSCVMSLSSTETLKLAKLDAERESSLTAIKNIDLEVSNSEYKINEQLALLKKQFDDYKIRKAEEKNQLIQQFNSKHASYREFVVEIAKRFDLDPDQMTYNTDTGAIRDLRIPKKDDAGGVLPA